MGGGEAQGAARAERFRLDQNHDVLLTRDRHFDLIGAKARQDQGPLHTEATELAEQRE